MVVAILFKAGDHEPGIPLFELTGSGLRDAPEHIGPTCANSGVIKVVQGIKHIMDFDLFIFEPPHDASVCMKKRTVPELFSDDQVIGVIP